MRRYESIKDSGLEWIGLIPQHWNVQLAKRLEKHTSDLAQTGPFGAQLHASDYVDEGIPLILTEEQAGWLISGQMLRLRFRSKEVLPSFLMHAISSDAVLTYFDFHVVGTTRDSINTEILSAMPLPLPPLPEQRAIADFLDRKTKAIDDLIQKKERLSELLQEKRQALITRAITKGLDPTVPMKDSGIEWLGEIPTHWEAFRLKFLKYGALQYGANEAANIDDPDLPRFVRITDITADGSLRDETFRSLPEGVARPYLLEEGDVLLARSGATVGKAFIYKRTWGRACFAGYPIRVRCNQRYVTPDYLYYYTQSDPYTTEVRLSTIQATIQNVSAEKYAEFRVPLPPMNEQRGIVAWLASELNQIAAINTKVTEQIDRLREYRQTLISAAVTGKIDVTTRRPHAGS